MSSFSNRLGAGAVDTMSPEDAEFRSKYSPGNLEVSQFKNGTVNYPDEREHGDYESRGRFASGDGSGNAGNFGSDQGQAGAQAQGSSYQSGQGNPDGEENAQDAQYLQQEGPRIQGEVAGMDDSELLTALSQIPNQGSPSAAGPTGSGAGLFGSSSGSSGAIDNPEETAKALLLERAQNRLARSQAFQDKVNLLNKKFGFGGKGSGSMSSGGMF